MSPGLSPGPFLLILLSPFAATSLNREDNGTVPSPCNTSLSQRTAVGTPELTLRKKHSAKIMSWRGYDGSEERAVGVTLPHVLVTLAGTSGLALQGNMTWPCGPRLGPPVQMCTHVTPGRSAAEGPGRVPRSERLVSPTPTSRGRVSPRLLRKPRSGQLVHVRNL